MLCSRRFSWPKFYVLFLLLGFSSTAKADQITSIENWNFWIHSVPARESSSGRLIQICDDANTGSAVCRNIPEENYLHQFGFEGNPSDWEMFFRRCSEFSSLNTLTSVTLILATSFMTPYVGGLKKIFDASRSWATFFRQGAVTFAAPGFVDHALADPYPSISPEEIQAAVLSLHVILNPGSMEIFRPQAELEALAHLLRSCPYGFEGFLVEQRAQECLSNCHGLERERSTTESARGLSQGTLDQAIRLDLVSPTGERIQSDEIRDYLQSISH